MKQYWRKLNRKYSALVSIVIIMLMAASIIVLTAGSSASKNPSQQKPFEDDWWLPSWVDPLPDVIGFYGEPPEDTPEQNLANQELKLVTFRWRDVNPKEGVYDWSILKNALENNDSIYIRLENSDVIHCPEWLGKKYPDLKPLKLEPYTDNFEVKSQGLFYPMWHPGFKREFKQLLQSFKEQEFGSDPRLKFAYIPGAWKWGEFEIDFVEEMKLQGMTPEDFLSWFKETIDMYVDAFGEENAHKLMYTGNDVIPLVDVDWRTKLDRQLFAYAMEKGCSTRFGLLEKYNFVATDMPNYGIRVVDRGGGLYMEADDNAPLIANPQRFIGSESEEIETKNIPISSYYQLKMSALKNLQVRANVVFLGARVWQKAPQLHQYMLKTLGKHYYDSPDAWCALREGKDIYQLWSRWNLGVKEGWWIRNFERWLIQREVEPDGKTVRTYYIETPVKHNEESYEARRTDHKNGSNYIYFGVDDKFIKENGKDIQIKVTYLDNNNQKWWIEYNAANGKAYKKSTVVKNLNDSKWKTTTFKIKDAAFVNSQRDRMDFRIFNGGRQDLTVRFVRLIKLMPPSK